MLEQYRNHLTLAGYRPNTVKDRIRCLRAFSEHLAPRTLSEAHRADVEAYLARPLSAESRRCYRSHLRAFYVWAVDEKLLSEDPTAKVPAIRVQHGTPRPIGDDALALALEKAPPRLRAWLLLMALGGLRACEVSRFEPADLVQVDQQTALLYLRETKGGGTATVPAHPAILQALGALCVRGDGLWWKVSPRWVSRSVAAHLHGLGLSCTGHQLRHYAATAWYRTSEHDLLTTSQLMRHVKADSTQIYAALDPTRGVTVVNLVPVPMLART
jgi:integrase